ncbi:Ferripyoverdine receptor [compost metagenome]
MSHPSVVRRAGLPALLSLAAALVISPAPSTLVAETRQAQSSTYRFDIPAQSLDGALATFSMATRVQVLVSGELTRGLHSPGLSGSYGQTEALSRLLAGTGLAARFVDGDTVTLERTVEAGGALELGATAITSNQLGAITEHSQSYTPGTIATATRLVLTPRETPQSISVVTRQEMDDFNLTAIDDVMRHTPGVSIVTLDSERTDYYARGFAIQNFQYDGIPMQRNSGYSSGNTLSDMAIYDRVEVLKGATGLLTGSGDPGATINLIRKKPTSELQGHGTLGAGSWDNYRTELDFSGPLTDSGNVRGRAVAAYQDKHSHLDRYQRKTSVFYGILEVDLSPDTLLTVGADYQDNEPEGSTWGGIPVYNSNGDFNKVSWSFSPATDWSSWEQYTRTVFTTLEHYFDNDWVAKLQLNHQINGYDNRMGSIGSGFPNPADGSGTSLWLGSYVGKTTSDAADAYASGPFQLFGREHELVVGGSLSRRKWENEGQWAGVAAVDNFYEWDGDYPEPNWARVDSDDQITRENGAYLASRFNLRDDLKLLVGSRVANYDGEDARESGVVVPYLGAVYDLNSVLSVYASYSNIFKPQTAEDEKGRTLDPLEGNNAEVGLKGAFFDDRLNASVAYFELEQDNFAESTGGRTPSGTPAYRSVSGVKTKGYELEVSGQLAPQWQVHAGYNHQTPRRNGERIATLAPESQFSLYTSYKLQGALSGLMLGGGARWQDSTWYRVAHPTLGKVRHTTDSYWLVDASARYALDEHLSAALTVNNLLDKKYYSLFDSTYTWGEPRSASVSLRYDF